MSVHGAARGVRGEPGPMGGWTIGSSYLSYLMDLVIRKTPYQDWDPARLY
mgnify:FL=1